MKYKFAIYFFCLQLSAVHNMMLAQSDSTLVAPSDSVRSVPVVEVDSLVRKADSLRTCYEFGKASELYGDIVGLCQDTTSMSGKDSTFLFQLQDRMSMVQNGISMSSFVASPNVIARKKFSLEDFYLYYPLPDKSWRLLPNVLDSSELVKPVNAVYFPEGDEKLYYSAFDSSGARNIYFTEKGDSLWTVPSLLNEYNTSDASEIFPMLSYDGKMLYFSSDGLYGVGGYDIYCSVWDEERSDWGNPVNVGFPYSSPANDYLFMNTPDGQYTIFASDRGCSSDSVWVYVLEYDSLPVRKEFTNPVELRDFCLLEPKHNYTGDEQPHGMDTEIPENLDLDRYMSKVSQVNVLRDTIYSRTVALEKMRNEYALSEDVGEREILTVKIGKGEADMTFLQDSLDTAARQLQEIEMEFLFNGVVIDPQKLMEDAGKEDLPDKYKFKFHKCVLGDSVRIELARPEQKFDYTFRIQDTSSFAEDNVLPDRLVYQIQLIAKRTKAEPSMLKGISPIFETKSPSGLYIYRAGLFNAYKDALSHLNTVKRRGFKTAKIVAFNKGRELTISAARSLEKKLAANPDIYEIVFDGAVVNAAMIDEVIALSGKDVAKVERNGKIVYIVGPFDNKAEADAVFIHLKNKGVAVLSQNKVNK